MDQTKKLELAIEIAKIEAINRLRIAVEKGESDATESEARNAGWLIREALMTLDDLLPEPQKPSAMGQLAAMKAVASAAEKRRR